MSEEFICLSNGHVAEAAEHKSETSFVHKVNEILELSKENLKTELLTILQENESLKARIAELEKLNDFDAAGFCIDSNPIDENDDNPLPSVEYFSATNDVLTVPVPTDSDPKEAIGNRVKGNNCWNCGKDDHSLRECTEPRNHQKISASRKEFLKNQPSGSVRYHVDEPQKFGHLRPGLPSRKLRKALGLHSDQIPSYIYRMRELGYPPGWLKEAEINHSSLGLYVEQNEALPDHGDEDGEIADAEDKKQYDVAKIQEWPGFNVSLDRDFSDESDKYRVCPMRPDQSKEEMLKSMSLKEQKAYVRGEMQDTSTKSSSNEERPIVTQAPVKEAKVISIDDGTPIVTMHSPYRNLPAQEKWTTNTTDHIFFENLPESTGKYDQMVELLRKVRSARK